MEKRERFVPVTRKALAALAATAFLAVGAACTAATQRGEPSPSPENSHTSIIETPFNDENNLIKTGEWDYMPGSEMKSDGLHVEHRGFKIVQQDGSGGQENPPVNEYGTYLEVPKDFTLRFLLDDIKGAASLQFYASPPIVSDEFRVEPKSIRLTFDGDKWTMKRWGGNGQEDLANQLPVDEKEFAATPGGKQLVEFVYTNDTVNLVINGKSAGSFAAGDTFADGQLWVGADAESKDGHFTIKKLEAEGKNSNKVKPVDISKLPAVDKRSDGLQTLAGKRLKIGANIATWAITDPKYRERIFGGDYGVVTPENALKWQFTEPLPGTYDFRGADGVVAEARKNNLNVHGHNLVFSEALPQWVQELPTETNEQKAYIRQILINHVTALVSHYKGVIDDWDINEIFADYDDGGTFTDNVFYRAMGPDYVREVAKAAKKANPNVRLWLNDYGLETDTGPRKQAADKFTKQLKQEGLIYGVGYQAHIYDTETDLIANESGQTPELSADLQRKAKDDIMARISELDAPAASSEYEKSSQSQQFVSVIKTCLAHPNCKAVSFWSVGPTDKWQDEGKLQTDSVDSMFDQVMNATRSYRDLQKVLR